ncbi:predicted protein [Arabidopsis lyrata subsp. lyrata]|uniref:Predicted protein n=1 Tax=Arabidopsis lyrata subsp. lyrata TaxID=81972 RepID=D7ME91_ARALL|nr:predicted protein [Arabidopsis lyrata subsp. lyrata]
MMEFVCRMKTTVDTMARSQSALQAKLSPLSLIPEVLAFGSRQIIGSINLTTVTSQVHQEPLNRMYQTSFYMGQSEGAANQKQLSLPAEVECDN